MRLKPVKVITEKMDVRFNNKTKTVDTYKKLMEDGTKVKISKHEFYRFVDKGLPMEALA